MDRIARIAEHRDELLGFLCRRVPRPVAEDILHDVLVKSVDKVDGVRDDEALLAWMYRALRNATIDHHRRAGAADRALARFAEETAEPDPTAASLEPAGETCRCVLRAAEALKPDQAKALLRVEVDGVAVKSFAEEEGISSGNAAVRLHRARHALRDRLVATCGSCAGANGRGCTACSCADGAADEEERM